ncbi:MAG TPA: hypothetical protein VGP95_20290 [Gemmatimonadaceae bacterium]|jgi:hypothetical protein|nr:hypothetical protein [Gemmatimonadaceae bacterium]
MRTRAALILSCIASVACNSGSASTSTVPEPANGVVRWTATFKQTQGASTAAIIPGQMGSSSAYGSISVTSQGTTPPSTRVELSVNAPVPSGTQVGWAIFTGGCGAPTLPVVNVHEFPTIEIAGNNNGSVRASLQVALDPRGTYHANVYWNAQVSDLNNVMMCANLARAR